MSADTRGTNRSQKSAEDLSRLPKWARERIELLTMRLEEKDRALTRAREAAGFRTDGDDDLHITPTHDRATVRWLIDDELHIYVDVSMRERNILRIGTPRGQIIINPVVSNAITIQVNDPAFGIIDETYQPRGT